MSPHLLDGLSVASQLLMQLAVRHEFAPLHYASVAPLDEAAALSAAAQVLERGLLKPAADAPAVMLLTPIGYSLRDAVVARWGELHGALRPRLIAHVQEQAGLDDDAPLLLALQRVDRADFLPDPTKPLADLDLPAPVGVAEMTTSAPHAIVAILSSVAPTPADRVLVCGVKAGVTIALSAAMVGARGWVLGLDDDEELAEFAAANLARSGFDSQAAVLHVADVTVGAAEQGPFDVIVVNGSVPKVPRDLVRQLTPGGRLLLFLQDAYGDGQACYVVGSDWAARRDEALSRFVFTPIFGRWGWDRVADLAVDSVPSLD